MLRALVVIGALLANTVALAAMTFGDQADNGDDGKVWWPPPGTTDDDEES